jgi:hypothetical protein
LKPLIRVWFASAEDLEGDMRLGKLNQQYIQDKMQEETAPDHRKTIRVAPFILALLCFALPFLQVSCKRIPVLSVTGVQLVTGAEVEGRNPLTGEMATHTIPSNDWIALALISTLLAIGLSFTKGLEWILFPAILGGSGLICMFVAKKSLDQQILIEGEGLLKIDCLPGFALMCFFMLVGAGISIYHFNQTKKSEAMKHQKPDSKVDP